MTSTPPAERPALRYRLARTGAGYALYRNNVLCGREVRVLGRTRQTVVLRYRPVLQTPADVPPASIVHTIPRHLLAGPGARA